MPDEVSSPLASIVAKLAATKVDGRATQLKKRFVDCSDKVYVLCDCSGSMIDAVGSIAMSKFEHLQIALEDLVKGYPDIGLIAFGSIAKVISGPDKLPDPRLSGVLGGSTNLAAALELAGRFRPRKTIVISDGLPDSESDALDAAAVMTGAIDTIYCGPDGHPAVDFLRQLSRSTGGTPVVWSGTPELGMGECIRGLLG